MAAAPAAGTLSPRDLDQLKRACELAHSCEPVASAYNVGAVLCDAAGAVLATGYSRELPGNTHAEECCFIKADGDPSLRSRVRGGTIYSSMEPCSRRLSGKVPCTVRCIEAGVARVVLAVKEPDTFVRDCAGVSELVEAGLSVSASDDAECRRLALTANRHLDGVDV